MIKNRRRAHKNAGFDFDKTRYKMGNESHSFSGLIYWMILICCVQICSGAGKVKTPWGWQAQTGVVSFTTTSPDSYTDTRFASVYDVTLQVLNLQGQIYQIVLGLGKVDQRYSPTTTPLPLTQVSAYITGDSSIATTFQIEVFVEEQNLLTSIKCNYLLIGAYLKSNSLMMGSLVNINLGASVCDGLTAPNTCTYSNGISYFSAFMDITQYKVFLSVSGFSLFSDSTTTTGPPFTTTGIQSKVEVKYTSFVSTTSNVITLVVDVDKVSFSLLSLYVIAAHVSMFDTTVEKRTILLEYSKTLTSAGTYQGTLAQKVLKTNYFMGLMGFKGPTWAFDVYQSTPFDLKINVRLYGSGSYLKIHGFVIYGYTDQCAMRRHCRACFIPPTYECTECRKNFLPTTPPNSICKCPSPYTYVSGICDIVPYGCIVAERLPDQSIRCHQCNIAQRLVINTALNECECIPKFEMDSNNVCQQICGDGFVIRSHCDDGNTFSGDGCSSTCTLEKGYTCDVSVEPTKCHSSFPLIYEIQSIMKIQNCNSAIIKLRLQNEFNYPFPVYKHQLEPSETYLKFKTILRYDPYNQLTITDFQLIDVDKDKVITIIFNFNVTVENTDAKIQLNYQQTYYRKYTQILSFRLKGDNQPLKFQDRIESFKQIGMGMFIGAFVSIALLICGVVTPKFIGLQAIVTLQLIFFSQILIFDNSKFPVGFLFLSNLKYTTGFNQIFEFSEYNSITDATKRMYHIKRHKMIIENFNINFIILFFVFLILVITSLIRRNNQINVIESKYVIRSKEEKEQLKKNPIKENLTLRKINEIAFYIANQIAFWLFLPLVSTLAAGIQIENYTLIIKTDHDHLINKSDELVAIFSFFMIYAIILSNFGSIWLGNFSMQTVNQRPEELQYKRWFFGYFNIVGIYIFFIYDMDSDGIKCSIVILLVHIFHMVYIYFLNPYKQSLKVHTIGMFFNNIIYFIYLIIINVINYYSEDIDQRVTLGLGYGMIFCCSISIIVTMIRLYYELKYGKDLQLKLQEERLKKQFEEKIKLELQRKRKKEQMQNQAMKRFSDKQRIRDKNFYLYQNQLKQDNQKQLMTWLEGRELLDQKAKDIQYFKQFTEKPFTWLQKNDKQKYDKKIQQIQQHLEKKRKRKAEIYQNKDHQTIVCKLRRQVIQMKQKQEASLQNHLKKMEKSTKYAMDIMKNEKQKFFQKGYTLKDKIKIESLKK